MSFHNIGILGFAALVLGLASAVSAQSSEASPSAYSVPHHRKLLPNVPEKHHGSFRQVQGRAKEGNIAQSEVQLAQSRLAATDAAAEAARAQQLLALSEMRQMQGGPLPSNAFSQGCALNGAAHLSSSVKQVQEWAAKNDPGLGKYAVGVRALNADLQAIRAQRYPELYLRGAYYQGDVTGESRKAAMGLSPDFGAGLSNASAQGAIQLRAEAQWEEFEARLRERNDPIVQWRAGSKISKDPRYC